jgi:serine/threonine protein phosphatase PrpC
MYRLEYAAMTHPGNVRDNNEDNFYVNGYWRKNAEQDSFAVDGIKGNGCLMAAVCDGMGGYDMGEAASLYAMEVLDTYCHNGEEKVFEPSPMEYINETNQKICDLMEQEGKRIGTTFAGLEFCDDRVNAVNLGDSRIYRWKEQKLKQISTDHTTVARLLQDGLLTKEEAKDYPLRHQITQHLGIRMQDMMLEPAVIREIPLENKDCFLICSDGLTDMLKDEKIEEILNVHRKQELQKTAEHLVGAAIDAGGRDNVTVVLVRVVGSAGWSERLKERFSWNIR